MYSDENLPQTRADRDPVQSAEPSETMKAKKNRAIKSHKDGESEGPMSFRTLLSCLATRCRNIQITKSDTDRREFTTITLMTPFQEKLFDRIQDIDQLSILAEATADSSAEDQK